MGCYGIGISRTLMASVEQHSTEDAILWPEELKPFDIHIIPVNTKDEAQSNLADSIYKELLSNGYQVLLDDRQERAGSKFKDADLIGIPIRIVVGKNAIDGNVELLNRNADEKVLVSAEDILKYI